MYSLLQVLILVATNLDLMATKFIPKKAQHKLKIASHTITATMPAFEGMHPPVLNPMGHALRLFRFESITSFKVYTKLQS